MKKKMVKVLWFFLIFVLTSNTKGFASAIDLSLSISAIPVSPSNYDGTALSASSNKMHTSGKLIGHCISTQNISCVIPLKIRGKKGRYAFASPFVTPRPVLRTGTPSLNLRGVQECASSFHPAKKLSTSGSAIVSAGSSSLTLNYISIDSIQQSKVTSNNLSDIFIPPKITI